MDQLTAFEKDLLSHFRRLAGEFEKSQTASKELSGDLKKLLDHISKRQTEIDGRLDKIEENQTRLSKALILQSERTESLIGQVNALLETQGN